MDEVIENLNNAIENGYSFEGMSSHEIALEMVEYTGSLSISIDEAAKVIDEYLSKLASKKK